MTITHNKFWIYISSSNMSGITGKWIINGSKQFLHSKQHVIEQLTNANIIRATIIAQKHPRYDPFPHKQCVMCVFTSDDANEKDNVRQILIGLGLIPSCWKSDSQTNKDWAKWGRLNIEYQVTNKIRAFMRFWKRK